MSIPDDARRTLARRVDLRRQERWPELVELNIRYRGSFAYVGGTTAEDDTCHCAGSVISAHPTTGASPSTRQQGRL